MTEQDYWDTRDWVNQIVSPGYGGLKQGANMNAVEYEVAKEKAAACRRIIAQVDATPLAQRADAMRKSEQCGIRSYLAELDASIAEYEEARSTSFIQRWRAVWTRKP